MTDMDLQLSISSVLALKYPLNTLVKIHTLHKIVQIIKHCKYLDKLDLLYLVTACG